MEDVPRAVTGGRTGLGTGVGTGVRSRPAPADVLLVVAIVVAAVGAVLGAVAVFRSGWTPTSDQAFIEMRVRDVPGDPPLLGVFSRYGWSHPGPAMFYLLALPYRLAGSASEALAAATLVAHVLVVAAAAWLARRLDRWAGVAVAVALLAVLLGAGVPATRDPWNPYVGLVASGLLVVVAWGTGERRALPAALLLPLATVLVQAHAAAAPLVAVTLVAAAVTAWSSGRLLPAVDPSPPDGAPRPVPWAALAAGAAVAAVAWVPPLVAQWRGDPGRIGELFSGGTGQGARVGVTGAVEALTSAFGPVPWWLGPDASEPYLPSGRSVPVWLLVPVAALVVARRRRLDVWFRGLLVSLAATLGVALGIAAFELGVVDGREEVFAYLAVPLRATAALSVALGLAAMASLVPDPRGERLRVAAGVLAVVVAAGFTVQQTSSSTPVPTLAPLARTLSTAVLDSPYRSDALLLVDPESYPGAEGVMLQLERAGVDVAVERPDFVTRVGPSRVVAAGATASRPGGAARLPMLVAGPDRVTELTDQGWTVIAACGAGRDDAGEVTLGGLVAVRAAAPVPGAAPGAAPRDAADGSLRPCEP